MIINKLVSMLLSIMPLQSHLADDSLMLQLHHFNSTSMTKEGKRPHSKPSPNVGTNSRGGLVMNSTDEKNRTPVTLSQSGHVLLCQIVPGLNDLLMGHPSVTESLW